MLWCGRSRESGVDCVVFPNSGDSSATPASSSVAIVHLWPKVSPPSRLSRRFLSVLPFNLQFRGCSHLIPFALISSALYYSSQSLWTLCTVRVNLHERLSSLHVWTQAPELLRPRSRASLSVPATDRSSSLDAPECCHDWWPSWPPPPWCARAPPAAEIRPPPLRLQRRWAHVRDPLDLFFRFLASSVHLVARIAIAADAKSSRPLPVRSCSSLYRGRRRPLFCV
jgi:hypothetical protein